MCCCLVVCREHLTWPWPLLQVGPAARHAASYKNSRWQGALGSRGQTGATSPVITSWFWSHRDTLRLKRSSSWPLRELREYRKCMANSVLTCKTTKQNKAGSLRAFDEGSKPLIKVNFTSQGQPLNGQATQQRRCHYKNPPILRAPGCQQLSPCPQQMFP